MGDWMGSGYDESTTLAFLDLFTSLALQEVFGIDTEPRVSLCLEHARKLTDSVLKNDPHNTRSRPFVQWILAKSAFEMRKARDSQRITALEEFPGLLLRQGDGVQLPVFVPRKYRERPDWHFFVMRPVDNQERSLQVALQTAKFLGDFDLQSTCLKLLILQSSEPTNYMDDLATLQLEKQQDKEGFLGTCLSQNLVTRPPMSATKFLRDTKRLDQVSGGSYLERGVNASLLWAKSMIREALLAEGAEEVTSSFTAAPDTESDLRKELANYGPRLPDYITDYIQSNAKIDIPKPFQPYRPPHIRFSDSTVGGRELLETRTSPRRTTIRPETGDEEGYRANSWSPRERRRLINRFEGVGRYAPTPDAGLESDSSETNEKGTTESDEQVSLERTSEPGKTGFPEVAYGDDGWPDFQIPRSFLRDNTMRVTLQNNSDPHRSRTYVLRGKGQHKAEVEVIQNEESSEPSNAFSHHASDNASDDDSNDSSRHGSTTKAKFGGSRTAKKFEEQPARVQRADDTADAHHRKGDEWKGKATTVEDVPKSSSSETPRGQISESKSHSDRRAHVEEDHSSTTFR
ncbi:hypothetical protein VMCG_05585 [Cytospora schulzeri]|uniref:Uncharacterized protein n=1 Tax=Cytospora schulzeri TaxID=448051 RepID=A0A423WEZ3_9PEZI|nr:hypothetical protein VMCG_05585 [Valsa malicola]